MKKNAVKIMYVIAIFIIVIMLFTTTCKARDISIITGNNHGTISGALMGFMQNAVGVAEVVGAVVATVMLFMLAIKYMTASASDKADVKQHAIVYIIGALFLYAGVAIVELIKVFMEGL